MLLGLRSLTDCLEIEYPRDLDSFVTSWGWRLDELIKSKKDLTALRSPVSRLAKIIEDFESETKIANNYYSKMIRKRLELIN